jgi:hypothetical protein
VATLYLKAAGGNFNGANWSTTGSGGGDSNTPTAADNCIAEAGSGALTINSGSVCRSFNCTSGTGNYAGTITHTAAVAWTIGDGTDGAGNVALKFVAGVTYTKGNTTTSSITFANSSNSGTAQTITWAGLTHGNVTFNGVGGSWQLQDASTAASSTAGTITLGNGTLDTNGKTCVWGVFSITGTATRTVKLGASSITLANTGTPFNATVTTNLTFNANTSTIIISGSGPIFQGGGLTYNTVNFTGAATKEIVGANTYANLSVVGTANLVNIVQFDASQIITGTLTLTGNSVVNRLFVTSQTVGTAITLTAATVSLTNIDCQDITGAGAASPFTGTSLGNAQGNSGITFSTPKNAYWVGTTANWSVANRWAATSGGTTGTGNYPLPQDTAIFDAASFSADGNVISFNSQGVQRHSSIDTSAVDQTFTLDAGGSLFRPCGSITLSNKTTVINFLEWIGRGSSTLTVNGATVASLYINGPGGTLTLQDTLTLSNALTNTTGTFHANGQAVTTASLSNGAVATMNMSTSTFTITGTGGSVVSLLGSPVTTNSSLVFSNMSADTSVIFTSGRTFNNLTISGGTGVFQFPGHFSNGLTTTFNNITVTTGGSAKNIRIQAGAIIQVTGTLSMTGAAGNVITIDSSGAGSAATISKASGVVSCDYLSLKDNTATGGAFFYAGANSSSVSNVTGWNFSAAPQGSFFLSL